MDYFDAFTNGCDAQRRQRNQHETTCCFSCRCCAAALPLRLLLPASNLSLAAACMQTVPSLAVKHGPAT
jgi:hypothetical protein